MTENAAVLFMDIVRYSLQPIATEKEWIEILQRTSQETPEFRRAQDAGGFIRNPTGDGIGLVFFGDPRAAVQCALEISTALKLHPIIPLRMGINFGAVERFRDVNGNENVVGEGINVAQRVMDPGDAGHILVSEAFVREVSGQDLPGSIDDLGFREVKHSIFVHLHNVHGLGVGNPELPSKFKSSGGPTRP